MTGRSAVVGEEKKGSARDPSATRDAKTVLSSLPKQHRRSHPERNTAAPQG